MTVRILGLVGERKGGCPTLDVFQLPSPKPAGTRNIPHHGTLQ